MKIGFLYNMKIFCLLSIISLIIFSNITELICNDSLLYKIEKLIPVDSAKAFMDKFSYGTKESEELMKLSLKLYRKIYKNESIGLARILNNMGNMVYSRGKFSESLEYLIESHNLIKKLNKSPSEELFMSCNNLSALYDDLGNYEEAEKLMNEALDLSKIIFKTDDRRLANFYNNVSVYYQNRGRIDDALKFAIEALAMRRRIQNNDNYELAFSIDRLAHVYDAINEYVKAEKLHREALEIYRRIYKNDHTNIAQSLTLLAFNQSYQKKNDVSLSLLKEALEIRRRIFKDSHPDLLSSIKNLAIQYFILDEFDESIKLMNEALNMANKVYPENMPEMSDLYLRAGELFFAAKMDSLAMVCFKKSFSITCYLMFQYFPALSESEKEKFRQSSLYDYNVFNSFLLKSEFNKMKNSEILFQNIQLFKGFLLNSSLKMKSRIIKSGIDSLISKYKNWQDSKILLSKLLTLTNLEKERTGINIDSIVTQSNQIEKELYRITYINNTEIDSSDFCSIKKNLNSDEALVDIIRLEFYGRGKVEDSIVYAALIIKKESDSPEIVILSNGDKLESDVTGIYKKLIETQKKGSFYENDIVKPLEEIYVKIWKDIDKSIKGKKIIYFSPDGIFNQINLNTLINPLSKKYIIDEYDIRIITQSKSLIKIKNSKIGNDEKKTAYLIGDPLFFSDSKSLANINSDFKNKNVPIRKKENQIISPLPGTNKEINEIKSLLKNNNWIAEVNSGANATESYIKTLNNPYLLHIATHGTFLNNRSIFNSNFKYLQNLSSVSNPLFHSLLLFSGAENKLINGENYLDSLEDGFLTAYEAQNLNLDNTELVVLSACETGLGEIKNGEGVYGLQRAFQVAGAKSLIMSLWSVSDQATQELMTSFYTKWLTGISKREAFRKSQSELKSKYPGFYYWGAFVMVGE